MARRLTAKKASIYIGGVKVADAYEMTFEIIGQSEESKAFEEFWDRPEPTGAGWKGTAKRYQSSGATTFMSRVKANMEGDVLARVIGYQTEGSAGSKVFEGDCWLDTGSVSLSRPGLVNEEITLLGYGDPVFVG